MAKVKSEAFSNALAKTGAHTRLFLFYGADEANSALLAERTRKHLGADAEKVELSGIQLKDDPALLAQEAASMSLFGDKRTIFVVGKGEECKEAITQLLQAQKIENPVIVQLSGITDKSATAKLVASDKNALGCISYRPEVGHVAQYVREVAQEKGLAMPRDIAMTIARYTQLDRRLAAIEVEKIALFLDAEPGSRKTVDDVVMAQLAAETEEDTLAPAINAIMSGQMAALPAQLSRLQDGSLQAVVLLRALQGRAVQLGHLHAALRAGQNSDSAMKSLGIFYKENAMISGQLNKWSPPALERLAMRLITVHHAVMNSSQDAVRLLSQECTAIAINAARAKARPSRYA